MSGDSALVFTDTVIPRFAVSYARAHPGERPLDPDEETNADPETSATADVDVLDTFGPYLTYEYHADIERRGQGLWHMTRRGVLDLRSGKQARVSELFGIDAARRIVDAGRRPV